MKLIQEKDFIAGYEDQAIKLYTLKNENGLTTQITNYGGRVVNLFVPDRDGNFGDIVLGYNTYKEYLNSNELYFGALVGRSGNRIANGQFELEGKQYQLTQNIAPHHLHGGTKGFHNVVWESNLIDDQTLELTYHSQDGEDGYPGNLKIIVTYTLTDEDELEVSYLATTDKPTILNPTHHSFFNLKGEGNGDINDHIMMINSNSITEVNGNIMPTGAFYSVESTPFDFRRPRVIGSRINEDNEQLKIGLGYDHNWVIQGEKDELNFAARVFEPKSGRAMSVYTDLPGMQFYGGNFLDSSDIGKSGKTYEYRSAFCLEVQNFPDSPNQPQFPSIQLNSDEEFYAMCIYSFEIQE